MRVSAVITAYNYARFLPGAIESVLAQTRLPDEIIVVDDGSTDNTAEVVARYADVGVRYVYRPNGGAGAARNTGIQESHGDLIAFLDGDDRWLPKKIALQLAHFERYPLVGLVTGSECQVHQNAECGMRNAEFRPPVQRVRNVMNMSGTMNWQSQETLVIPHSQGPYYLRRTPVGSASFYPAILVENTIGNPSLAMVRRECFDRVGLFDETMPLGQDWDMWIRIARVLPVGVVDDVLILFTRHQASLTAGGVQARYNSNKQLQRRHIRQVGGLMLRLRLQMAAQSMNLYYMAAALADARKDRLRATGAAFAAALLDPTYESRNKAGLLVRTAFGRSTFRILKALAGQV